VCENLSYSPRCLVLVPPFSGLCPFNLDNLGNDPCVRIGCWFLFRPPLFDCLVLVCIDGRKVLPPIRQLRVLGSHRDDFLWLTSLEVSIPLVLKLKSSFPAGKTVPKLVRLVTPLRAAILGDWCNDNPRIGSLVVSNLHVILVDVEERASASVCANVGCLSESVSDSSCVWCIPLVCDEKSHFGLVWFGLVCLVLVGVGLVLVWLRSLEKVLESFEGFQ
jgi:hypothetical protein